MDWCLYGDDKRKEMDRDLKPEYLLDDLRRYQDVFGEEFGVKELLMLEDIRWSLHRYLRDLQCTSGESSSSGSADHSRCFMLCRSDPGKPRECTEGYGNVPDRYCQIKLPD